MVKIVRSDVADLPDILHLLQSARRENLSPEERRRRGFIQGKIDQNVLTMMQKDTGVFVAKESGQIMGVACTSSFGLFPHSPIHQAGQIVLKVCKNLRPEDVFQYGPVVVHPEWRGKGLLRRLLTHVCREHSAVFKKGLAFVEEENQLSLVIHRHYFTKEFDSFQLGDALYYIFLFDPGDFVEALPS